MRAWMGIGEIKDRDGEDYIQRLREGMRGVKLGNVKS